MKKYLLLLLFFILIFVGWQIFKDKKYGECIKACKENRSCVESKINPEGGFYGFCEKWSDTECNNICVKKYK